MKIKLSFLISKKRKSLWSKNQNVKIDFAQCGALDAKCSDPKSDSEFGDGHFA